MREQITIFLVRDMVNGEVIHVTDEREEAEVVCESSKRSFVYDPETGQDKWQTQPVVEERIAELLPLEELIEV